MGRPRGAVDEARTALTAPLSSLSYGKQMEHANQILRDAAIKKNLQEETKEDGPGIIIMTGGGTNGNHYDGKNIMSLDDTPV